MQEVNKNTSLAYSWLQATINKPSINLKSKWITTLGKDINDSQWESVYFLINALLAPDSKKLFIRYLHSGTLLLTNYTTGIHKPQISVGDVRTKQA